MEPDPHARSARPRGAALPLAWFRLLHPFPSFLVTAAAGLFAELACGGHAPADRVLRLLLSVLCSQFAIGSANDVVDRDLDAATKPWKPVARGAIAVRAAATLALALSAACLALSASLGPLTLLAACVGLGCGLAYDVRLKRGTWSWLPYGVALPTLPIWAWVAMDRLQGRLLLVYPLGLLLGLALHLANTLPDLEGDRAFGLRGFAHALGARRSRLLCWGTMLLTQGLTLALAPLLHYRGWAYPAGLALSLALTAASAALYRARPTTRTLQINFGLLALAALALAVGWLAGAVA